MSEPIDDAALDRLIDEAAGTLTNAPLRRDFQARVRARIDQPRRAGWTLGWFIPGAAVAAAGLAFVVYFGERTPADVEPADAGSGSNVGAGFSRTTSPDVGSGFSQNSRPGQTASAAVAIEESPTGFESIVNPEMTIDPIEASSLTSIDVLDVETIPMDSLEVNPLSTQ